MLSSLQYKWALVVQLSMREIAARYRGSFLGVAWSFLNPLFMLVVYTFVFSVVFKARWGESYGDSKADFALILFVGLLVHGLFAESVNRAPSLIVSNTNYVKKVVFPLEVLPVVAFISAFFHVIVGLCVLVLAQLLINHSLPLTAFFFPIVLFPLVLGSLGLSWFLAALGVYLRDIGQLTQMFTTVMLFVSGVFFPLSSLPAKYHFVLTFNPLAVIIDQSRSVLIFGKSPDPLAWSALMAAGLAMALMGYGWFQKTRRGFADVL